MAIRKNIKDAGRKAAKSAAGKVVGRFRRALKLLYAVLLICAGGVLFNLDRLGNTGIILLKYKSFLPGIVTRFLPGGSALDGTAVPEQIIDGQIIEVYDGDTATLLDSGERKYKIRFFGIDAPEAAQSFGSRSRDLLREKILGKNVSVTVISVDRYGRAVGKVMLGVRYINLEMVDEGAAWYYADYARNEYDLAMAQERARSRKSGIWSASSLPQPPWEWRRSNNK